MMQIMATLLIFFVFLTMMAGAEPANPDMTVMGKLSWYGEKNRTFWWIEPWVVCRNNAYASIHVSEIGGDERANAESIQKRRSLRLSGNTFWLYNQGVEIGTFEIQAGAVTGNNPNWTGRVSWKGKPLSTEEVNQRNIIALSRPIPQNFWLPQNRLTPEQSSGFRQLLSATLTWTPKDFKSRTKPGTDGAQRPVGRIGQKHFFVWDLDQDGQIEVYGELKCEGKPCTMMVGDLFAFWQGKWNVLRQATYWAYCPGAEAVGDRHFRVTPVDLDGDGRAEVFIEHGFYETWGITLFHYQGGRLMKKLEFGEGGT